MNRHRGERGAKGERVCVRANECRCGCVKVGGRGYYAVCVLIFLHLIILADGSDHVGKLSRACQQVWGEKPVPWSTSGSRWCGTTQPQRLKSRRHPGPKPLCNARTLATTGVDFPALARACTPTIERGGRQRNKARRTMTSRI